MFEYSEHTLQQIYTLVKAGMQRHNVDDAEISWYVSVCHTFGINPTETLHREQLPKLLFARFKGIHRLMVKQVMPILPVTFADALFQKCLCGTPLVGYQACSEFYLQGRICRHTDVLFQLLNLCLMHSVITAGIAGMTQDEFDNMIEQLEDTGWLRVVCRIATDGGYITCITTIGGNLLEVYARLQMS